MGTLVAAVLLEQLQGKYKGLYTAEVTDLYKQELKKYEGEHDEIKQEDLSSLIEILPFGKCEDVGGMIYRAAMEYGKMRDRQQDIVLTPAYVSDLMTDISNLDSSSVVLEIKTSYLIQFKIA